MSETALYRHYDNAGRLLYVGISKCAITRLAAHGQEAPWYRRIATVTIDWHPTRAAAEVAERLAIRTERPECNRQRYGCQAEPGATKPCIRWDGEFWVAQQFRADGATRIGIGSTAKAAWESLLEGGTWVRILAEPEVAA